MRLTFLGKETQGGGSPTLFLSDRDTYVVQGWRVPGEDHTTVIEIPACLLAHLQPKTGLGTPLRDSGRQWHDDTGTAWPTYILTGAAVTDEQALAEMHIPDHESCVEVRKQGKEDGGETTTG